MGTEKLQADISQRVNLTSSMLRSIRTSNVEVQNPPAPVFDYEEAVEQLKSHSRHGEKVDSHDHLAVILKEGQPPFFRVATALHPSKIARYGPFRHGEADLLKFAVDSGGSPTRIL